MLGQAIQYVWIYVPLNLTYRFKKCCVFMISWTYCHSYIVIVRFLWWGCMADHSKKARPVVPEGAGGAMAPPDFGRSVNLISTRGTDYAHLITTGTPGFSDLQTVWCSTNITTNQNQFRTVFGIASMYINKLIIKPLWFLDKEIQILTAPALCNHLTV